MPLRMRKTAVCTCMYVHRWMLCSFVSCCCLLFVLFLLLLLLDLHHNHGHILSVFQACVLSFFPSLFTERLLSDATVFFKTDSYMCIMHCACFRKTRFGDIPVLVILAFRQSRHRKVPLLVSFFFSPPPPPPPTPPFFYCNLFIIIVTLFLELLQFKQMSRTSFWKLETHIASQLSTLDEIKSLPQPYSDLVSEARFRGTLRDLVSEARFRGALRDLVSEHEASFRGTLRDLVSKASFRGTLRDLVSKASFRGTLPWPGVWGKFQRYLTVTWCLRQVSEVPYHDLVSGACFRGTLRDLVFEASFRGTLPWPGVWGMFQRYLTVTWCRRQVSEVHSSEPASEGHSLVRCTSSQRLSSMALWSGPVSCLSRVELKTPIILLILPSIIYVGWAVPEQESFFSNSNQYLIQDALNHGFMVCTKHSGRVVAVREAWFAPSV